MVDSSLDSVAAASFDFIDGFRLKSGSEKFSTV
jgi:hypothetical protein